MHIPAGTVVDSDAVIKATSLVEDVKCILLDQGAEDGFTLSVKQEEALLESLAEIERGDWISLEDLMVTLPRQVDSAA
jgi:hypothetical protein